MRVSSTSAELEAFKRFEREGWRDAEKAALYKRFFTRVSSQSGAALLDAAGVQRASRVLDVGCGPGNISRLAADRGATVTGCDMSPQMLAEARDASPHIAFRNEDAEFLSFDDTRFDAVVGNFLILHLAHPERAAEQFHRVLVPGGRVALTVWDTSERCRFTGLFIDALALADARPPTSLPAVPPQFLFAADGGSAFKSLLADAGFDGARCELINYDATFPTTEALWKGMLGSGVRIAAMIYGQSDEVQARVREEFESLATAHVEPDGTLRVPVSVVLASAGR
jgi:ubiquinone/menaquinone biosynthesis C-methylase UbiE